MRRYNHSHNTESDIYPLENYLEVEQCNIQKLSLVYYYHSQNRCY